MESIPDIFFTSVPPDDGVRYKFKIDSIAMPGDRVTNDLHAVAFPAVNSISGLLFGGTASGELIIFDDAFKTELRKNTKIIFFQDASDSAWILAAKGLGEMKREFGE